MKNQTVFVSNGAGRVLQDSSSGSLPLAEAVFPQLKNKSWELVIDHSDVRVLVIDMPPIRSGKDWRAIGGWKLRKEFGAGFDFFYDVLPFPKTEGPRKAAVVFFRMEGLSSFLERMAGQGSLPSRIDLFLSRAASFLASENHGPGILSVLRHDGGRAVFSVAEGVFKEFAGVPDSAWTLMSGGEGLRSPDGTVYPLAALISARACTDFSPDELVRRRGRARFRTLVLAASFLIFAWSGARLAFLSGNAAGIAFVLHRAHTLPETLRLMDPPLRKASSDIALAEAAFSRAAFVESLCFDWPLWVVRLGNIIPEDTRLKEIRQYPARRLVEIVLESRSLESVLVMIADLEKEGLMVRSRLVKSISTDSGFECLVEGEPR